MMLLQDAMDDAEGMPDVSDLRVTGEEAQPRPEWGSREDGSPKGTGHLGVLRTPAGNIATEYTVGVEIGGKQIDIPTLVPTLTREEVEQVLRAADDPTNKIQIPDSVIDKAIDFAQRRLSAGQSVFANTPTPALREPLIPMTPGR